MIWLLIGYIWLFVHRPFEEWPWLGALRIERIFMIVTILYWMVSAPSLPKWNRLHTAFACFVGVVLLSWLASPYQSAGQLAVENYLKYVVFYVLLITSVKNERDLRYVMLGYVGVMGLFMAHSANEWFNGRVFWSSMGIHRMPGVGVTFSHPNDFAGLIAMSLPFGYLFWPEATSRWKQLAVLGYFGLSLFCIVRTGSRMGLCGVLFCGGLLVLTASRPWRLRLAAAAPVLLVLAWMLVPEEYQARYWTLIDPESGNVASQASSANYRSAGFWQGLGLMGKSPLLGNGPGATRVFLGHQAHNTYGQLLGELGLAGVFGYGWILVAIAANFFQARRLQRRLTAGADALPYRTVMVATATLLLTALMGWGLHFLFWHVWLWFGGFQAVALVCLQRQVAASETEALDAPAYAGMNIEAALGS